LTTHLSLVHVITPDDLIGTKTVFQMVELLKPKQAIDSRKQPIVCFGTITEKLF